MMVPLYNMENICREPGKFRFSYGDMDWIHF